MAVLDITGVLVTVAAAVVLLRNERTDQRWWWAVGLASLLAVLTTALLTRIADRRRSFVNASRQVADSLDEVAQAQGKIPPDLWKSALEYRDAARASGDLAVAERLTVGLARWS